MESKSSKKLKNKKEFRIRSKRFFLTYPKVIDLLNLEELFLESMREVFGKGTSMNYIIVKEAHLDGTPHIHVYLEFEEKQCIYSREKLHVRLKDNDGKEYIQEGKYESVRNRRGVVAYVLKDTGCPYITNMTLPIVNGAVYSDPEEHLLAVLETQGLDAATDVLISEYKELAARKASSIVRNLRTIDSILRRQNFKRSIQIRDISEFDVPEEILNWKTNLSDKTALILHGPSGTGKTEFCKSLFKSMNLEVIFIRDINALGKLDIGENVGLIFDDISLHNRTREELIHLFDLENHSQLRVL